MMLFTLCFMLSTLRLLPIIATLALRRFRRHACHHYDVFATLRS